MFSYLGGKKFQAKWIARHFPKHKTYVEPFGGAYWVYFVANHQIDQAHTNVYNDFNKADLIPFNTDFELGDVERATKYIYLQSQSFSGDTLNEKTKFVNLKGKYKSKYEHFINKISNKKWLYHIQGITHIHNESYETLIDEYDNDDTLFYCDPPYYKMEDYYVQDFQRHQHKELAEKLKSIKGKFVLS